MLHVELDGPHRRPSWLSRLMRRLAWLLGATLLVGGCQPRPDPEVVATGSIVRVQDVCIAVTVVPRDKKPNAVTMVHVPCPPVEAPQ